jgi:hypothetical protein
VFRVENDTKHVTDTKHVETDTKRDGPPTPPGERTGGAGSRANISADYYPLAEALAEVCRMDFDANRGRLFREAELLAKATPTPTPEAIRQHYGPRGWWRAHDWRGRKGEQPTPGAIRETWARVIQKSESRDEQIRRESTVKEEVPAKVPRLDAEGRDLDAWSELPGYSAIDAPGGET